MGLLRRQPQGLIAIDWSNPITKDMVLLFVHNHVALGFSVNGNQQYTYNNTTKVNTPVGQGIVTTGAAYSVTGHGLLSPNYSLFAVGTANSTSSTQSALDMDNSSPRYFQFRLAGGKVDFIPFNNSPTPAVTGQATAPAAMSLADMNKGFTMGATASPTRTACFQNGALAATGSPTNLASLSHSMPVYVGARATGTQPWNTGGLSLVVAWNRTLTDAEMLNLSRNPWQLFVGIVDDDLDFYSLAPDVGASYSYTGTGGITTSGEGMLLRLRNALSSGGLSLGGQATTGSLLSRIVTASGGLLFSSTAAVSKQTSRTTNAIWSFLGSANVISQVAGQTIEEVFGTLNDIMTQKLRALGNVGALRDMLNENKYWRALAGDNSRPINEVKKAYLKSQGLSGHLNDMEKQYWKNK